MSLYIFKTAQSTDSVSASDSLDLNSSDLIVPMLTNPLDPLYINKIYTLYPVEGRIFYIDNFKDYIDFSSKHAFNDSMGRDLVSTYTCTGNEIYPCFVPRLVDINKELIKTARDYRSRDKYYFNTLSLNSLFCVNNHYLNQGRFMGDDLESNDGSRFYQRALNAKYAIKGERRRSYNKFYSLPDHIQRRLDEINRGDFADDENTDIRFKESRFYHKVAAMQEQNRFNESKKDKFRRNSKIALIVCLGFAAYYYYVENYRKDINTVEDMIASLPLKLDEHTTMTSIEDKEHEFIMTIVKDGSLYAHVDAQKRDESLDRIVKNAQNLCSNPLIGSIVSSGRKVTVLLQSDDNSFERTITIDSCKRKTSQQ